MRSTNAVDGTRVPPDSLLSVLAGKYSAQILNAARTPTSAQELSERIDVPIATCYRRIEDLEEAGLLRCEGRQLSDDGRRTNVYRRTVDTMTFDFTDQSPTIEYRERSEAKNQLQDQLDE